MALTAESEPGGHWYRLHRATCGGDLLGGLRGQAVSAPADGHRLLLVKSDGSVSVHADDRAYKPLNWMSPPCTLKDETSKKGVGTWTVTNKTGDQLVITIDEVLHDSSHELGIDPGLVKDGVEAHLQELLAEQVQKLGDGWRLVRREFPTAIGPVDLMCKDANGGSVAVEIKRRGKLMALNSSPATWNYSIGIHYWHPWRGSSPPGDQTAGTCPRGRSWN